MTHVLVFGGDGQVGRELRRRAPEGCSVTPIHRQDADISDGSRVAQLVADIAPDVVINAAAYTAVDAAEDDAEAAFAVNRDGAGNVAVACANTRRALIHLSTDYVFDGTAGRPYREADLCNPLGVYGRSKEAGERAVRSATDRYAILRTAWVYSVHRHNFLRTMIRVGNERSVLKVVADQHGTPTPATAIADGCFQIAANLREAVTAPEMTGTFHMTCDGATTWHGFAEAIFEEARRHGLEDRPRVDPIPSAEWPTRSPRPPDSRLDTARLYRVHGVRLPSWRDALKPVVAEMLAARNDGESS